MKHLLLTLMILIPTISPAQDMCGETQPTLRDYHIAEYGKSYVNGNGVLPPINDSETCEKIRYDMRVYACRNSAASVSRPRRLDLETDAAGTPVSVQRAQNADARQVGGEAAKQRNIDEARRLYQIDLARENAALATMEKAKSDYLVAFRLLTENKCANGIFVEGKDPFIDGR